MADVQIAEGALADAVRPTKPTATLGAPVNEAFSRTQIALESVQVPLQPKERLTPVR
jgi:hypothetical protein